MKKVKLIALLILISTSIVYANEDEKLINLKGNWRFSIGDRKEWAAPGFNDSDWERIAVPSAWEDQGFYGYNGYAWYRVKFNVPDVYKGRQLFLVLGFIDDVDEAYFNGEVVGSAGSFPPRYETAFNAHRKYLIPENLIKYNQTNVIAVKVYDQELAGGIVGGEPGIYGGKFDMRLDVNLQGKWKFKIGDKAEWKSNGLQDAGWEQIFVPNFWEDQGYRNIDGFAWYRKKIKLPAGLHSKRMVMVLGKIDDADQLYINGKLVASTGNWNNGHRNPDAREEYRDFRGYYIPDGYLTAGENTIAVRVFDKGGGGGIYEGPVGLITQEKYIAYWKERKRRI